MSKDEWTNERERLLDVLAAFERGNRAFDEDERGELTRDVTDERIASLNERIAYLDTKLGDLGSA